MILKLAFKHIVSKPFLSLFTLAAVTCSLTFLGTFWTLVENLQRVKFERETQNESPAVAPSLSIFLDSKLDKTELDSVQKKLLSTNKFSKIEIISSAESLKALEDQFGETLTKAMGTELLPVTMKALLKDNTVKNDEFLNLLNEVRSMKGVLDIDDGSSIIPAANTGLSTRVFSWATILLLAVFLMVALLVSHLVRIAFETLRPEVETLKILGASKLWIFKPLILEALFFGILGALLSLFALLLAVEYLLPRFAGVLYARGLQFQALSATSALSLVGIAVGASIVGALFTWPLLQKSPTEI